MKIMGQSSNGSAGSFESVGLLVRLNDGTEIHLSEADVDKPGENPQSALVAILVSPDSAKSATVFTARQGATGLWLSRAPIPPERMSILSGSLRSGQTRPGSAGGAEGREEEGKE